MCEDVGGTPIAGALHSVDRAGSGAGMGDSCCLGREGQGWVHHRLELEIAWCAPSDTKDMSASLTLDGSNPNEKRCVETGKL